MIKLKYQTVFNELDELEEFREPIYTHHNHLHGLPKPDDILKDWVGWVDLPADEKLNTKLVNKIVKTRRRLKRLKIDTLVVVGVGGSLNGTKAVYDLVRPSYKKRHEDHIEIVFMGYTMNERHLQATLNYLHDKNFAVNLVSRSGSTLEIKVAFNLILKALKEKYTDRELWKRVIVTSLADGPLHTFVKEEAKGAEFYEIPADIGGRYSTLTAVGLLPLGIADINIKDLLEGAYEAYEELIYPIPQNPAYLYACSRASLYSRHYKKTELGVVFEPSMESFMKWWRMIFAESEGKDGWGLFPGIALYTSDLHTLGQWIQEGDSDLAFESFQIIRQEGNLFLDENLLSEDYKFLSNHSVADMEFAVLRAALDAHKNRMSYIDDNYEEKVHNPVPHIVFEWDDYTEKTIGYALYFFQKAAAMYCLLIGVNPFDQPGVEEYKRLAYEYIRKGDMYKESEDVILDYTPPAVDLAEISEEEVIEQQIVEEERAKEEIEWDEDTEEVTDEMLFDETDEDIDVILSEDTDEEVITETITGETVARETASDSRVVIDTEEGRERIGIEEVGEIKITIKPNREIIVPSSYVVRRPGVTKPVKKVKSKSKKISNKKKEASKKTTKRKPVIKASASNKKRMIKAKASSRKADAFTKINF